MGRKQYGLHKSEALIEGIPHMIQDDNWDCGLACLKMSLRYLHPQKTDADISQACKKHELGQSVWTIDLAYLCSHLGVEHQYYTQTLGANSDYANEAFYQSQIRGSFSGEESRVNQLFSAAGERGVKLEKASIGIEKILLHIDNGLPVIVLINDIEFRRKRPSHDQHHAALCCWMKCCFGAGTKNGYSDVDAENHAAHGSQAEEGYWGHYVVAVGYNLNRQVVIVNDPSRGGQHVECDFETFDRARKSFGTDEDLLFLFSP